MTDCLTGQRQYAHARPDDPLMHSANDSAQVQEHEAHPPLPHGPVAPQPRRASRCRSPGALHDYIGLHCAPDDIFGTHRRSTKISTSLSAPLRPSSSIARTGASGRGRSDDARMVIIVSERLNRPDFGLSSTEPPLLTRG